MNFKEAEMKAQSTFTTMPAAARFAIVLFATLGLAAVVYAVIFHMGFAPGRLFLLMAAASVCARAKVKLYKTSTISLLTAVVLLAVIQEGLASALIVAVFGVMVQTVVPSKKMVLHQLAFNFGMIALTVTATWFTHQSLAGARIANPLSTEAMATLIASFVYFLGNSISVSLIIALTKRMSMAEVWLKHFMCSAPSFLLAGLLSLGVVALISSQSLALVAALVAIICLAYYSSVRLAANPVIQELGVTK
jgi:hypothetical protein